MRYLWQWHCSFSTSGHKNCLKKTLCALLAGNYIFKPSRRVPWNLFLFVRMNTFVYYHSALLAHFPPEDTKISEELRGAPRESPHNRDFEETVNLIVDLWPTFLKQFTDSYIFWTVSGSISHIFHIYIPCEEVFLFTPNFWPSHLHHDLWPIHVCLKFLTFALTFKPFEVGLSFWDTFSVDETLSNDACPISMILWPWLSPLY